MVPFDNPVVPEEQRITATIELPLIPKLCGLSSKKILLIFEGMLKKSLEMSESNNIYKILKIIPKTIYIYSRSPVWDSSNSVT